MIATWGWKKGCDGFVARFLALSASIFNDPLLWGREEYCRVRAAVDLCGMATFGKRRFEEGDVCLDLQVRETRPLSVRFLMHRWGWRSTATVSRFLSALETRTGTLTKHRTTQIGNTYLIGERLLALCGETPNETRTETPNETPNETKKKKDSRKIEYTPPPTGEGAVAPDETAWSEQGGVIVPQPNGAGMTAAILIGAWIRWRTEHGLPRPSQSEIAKQGKFAARICRDNDPQHIVAAFVGIQSLTPHGEPFNQPWDMGTLREKFTRARDNVMNHPQVRAAQEDADLLDMLEDL